MPLSWSSPRKLRILDFDIENRPLSYWYDGNCTAEVTAIGCKWIGEPDAYVWLLGDSDLPDMLEAFRVLYDAADIVTGHYIRRHDLPILNGALTEHGLPKLASKMTHDTKLDLLKRSGISSSQESLGATLGLEHPKVQMDQQKWRNANRLTKEGRDLTRERVLGDVLQHIELRQRLMDLGYLGPPRVWQSGGGVGTNGVYAS